VRTLGAALALAVSTAFASADAVDVTIDDAAALHSFDPAHALGAAVDGHEKGEVQRMLSPSNARAMRSAGLRSLSYRLRTELAGEAWHWNPRGQWSDALHKQGYWVSSPQSKKPIRVSYGYRLPRRGNTHDQANDDGYSRIDDGDEATFWKSNPYLDARFTHDGDDAHPQWIVIDAGGAPVNAVRILWAAPFATRYAVEYTNSADGPEDFASDEIWTPFPRGGVADGAGGRAELTLADEPVTAQYVRIRMTRSSHTAAAGSQDIRDSLGYAVREIWLGTRDGTGAFHDTIRHGASNGDQTTIWVSSTDPWHRASDRDDRTEQPGFDLVFRRGLADAQPAMIPAGVLYDVPENAVAELKFLRARGYRVGRFELGEEPDEQYGPAEDYGALYLEWADALHAIDPALQLGGPSLVADSTTPDPDSHSPYLNRLLAYFKARGRLQDFSFFSFEWYPFDDVCDPVAPQLAEAAELLRATMARFHDEGVPASLPIAITEYGYSAYGAEPEVDLPGALIGADIVGQFLTAGGDQAFLYGWEPNELINEKSCSWGNNAMFVDTGRAPTAIYHAARLLTGRWLAAAGIHEIYGAQTGEGSLVRAYPVRRPDGAWAVLLINVDPEHAYEARLRLKSGAVLNVAAAWHFSAAQYKWHADGENGYPELSLPAVSVAPAADGVIELPAYSITVVRSR